MAVTYPTLRVKADSEMLIATNGPNDVTGGIALSDLTGTLLTNANATAWVTITITNSGASVLARTQMNYVAAAGAVTQYWSYTVAGTIMRTNQGPWTVKIEIFDQTGVNGTLLRTFYLNAKETD